MPICLYAGIQEVTIEAVTPTEVTFRTRSSANALEKFKVARAEIWPQPSAQAPAPVALTQGAVGNLYMTREGWKARATSGAAIFKAGDDHVVFFKWPECSAAVRVIETLSVPPTQIALSGSSPSVQGTVTLNLWGSECATSQSINWNAAQNIKVALSAEGQHKYGVNALEVWPASIKVSGKPAGGRAATVDLLDAQLADFTQHLRWTDHGQSVQLRLSTAGFGLFDVPTDALRRFAQGLDGEYFWAKEIIEEWKGFDVHHSLNNELKDLVARAGDRFAKLPVPQQIGDPL